MQSVDNDFCNVGVSLFEGLKNAHQHGLRFRSSLADLSSKKELRKMLSDQWKPRNA